MSDRQWMSFRRSLPFVLAQDDHIRAACTFRDTLDDLAFKHEPARAWQPACRLFVKDLGGLVRVTMSQINGT